MCDNCSTVSAQRVAGLQSSRCLSGLRPFQPVLRASTRRCGVAAIAASGLFPQFPGMSTIVDTSGMAAQVASTVSTSQWRPRGQLAAVPPDHTCCKRRNSSHPSAWKVAITLAACLAFDDTTCEQWFTQRAAACSAALGSLGLVLFLLSRARSSLHAVAPGLLQCAGCRLATERMPVAHLLQPAFGCFWAQEAGVFAGFLCYHLPQLSMA